jgi:hypothetical protein
MTSSRATPLPVQPSPFLPDQAVNIRKRRHGGCKQKVGYYCPFFTDIIFSAVQYMEG